MRRGMEGHASGYSPRAGADTWADHVGNPGLPEARMAGDSGRIGRAQAFSGADLNLGRRSVEPSDYRARAQDRTFRATHGLGLGLRTRESGATLRLLGDAAPDSPFSGPSPHPRSGLVALMCLVAVLCLCVAWWSDITLEELIGWLLSVGAALAVTACLYGIAEGDGRTDQP